MSFLVSTADLPSSQAGGTSVEDDGDDVVATIPIKVPLPTIAPTSASETPPTEALMPVLSDVELLAAFVQRRDPAAFTHIVERYGPMVYRVALRAVDDTHSADDVYQATFLVLAQSAHKIRSGEVLPAWLHGTARNIARRLLAHLALERRQLAQLAQQTLAEKGGEMTPSTELDPFEQLTRLNEQQLLDEELQQLPEASRAPLVLFYLEGQTQSEIAQQMGLSVEAVEGRLRRAKQELRLRLVRRGVFLSTVVAAATVLTPSIACAAPASTLVSATLATALGTTAVGTSLLGGTAASTTLTASVPTAAKLAAQEVAAMSAASKATAIFLTTAASTTVATGLLFGAIAGSLWGVPGLAPSVSDSPTVEMASPLNIVREEGEPDPFSLEREQPVLLALVEPDQVPEENRLKTTVYQVGDLNADSLKWVRQFFEANADSVVEHKPTKGLVVRATSESHLKISEMLTALRNQQIPGESEVALNSVPETATQEVGDAPQDQTQVELPATVSTPEDTDESDGRFRMTRQYDVSDFDADLRKKFVDFYKLSKSVTFDDNIMKIRASHEDHWLYQFALDNYREKRDQGKLNESEFDSVLSLLRSEYAKAPDAARQKLIAAEQDLIDRELTHGRVDKGTGDLRRRVELWQAVVNAVRNPEDSKSLGKPAFQASESSPVAKPVVYQIADLDIDHKWIALEYARTLDVHVASHESTHSFVVRANDEVHRQISTFIGNLRKAAYEKNIESVSRQIAWRLKTHSDNHPAVEQLRQLLAQLERVEKEHGELQAEAMNNDLFARHRNLSFFAGVAEETQAGEEESASNTHQDPEASKLLDNQVVTIDTPESSLRLVLNQSRKLTFPTKITTVDGFASKLLTVTPQAVDTIRVEALAVGETEMEVTCESGKKYIVTVLVNTPIEHALQDELVRQKDAEILKWQQNYRTEQVEKEQIRDELARQSKELNERVSRLNKIVDFQRQRFDELAPPMDCFPLADGKITTVDNATGTVWINLGRKNGLRTQLTFSVYDKTHKGLGRDPQDVKAKLEVVEVREASSIARVVEEERDRPIAVGDEIFSPAWCEGLPEHFALVGNGDLNADGSIDAKDRKILKDLLAHSGATLDVEVTDDGKRLPADGKLTVQTKWLIVGDLDQDAVLEETSYKSRKQKLNQALDRDIALAQRALSTSPEEAVSLLEGIRAAILSAPIDSYDASNLLRRADAALSDTKNKLEVQKAPAPAENPHKKEAETNPQKLEPTAAEKAKQLKQLVDRIRELMDEGYHFLPNAVQGAGISKAEPQPLNTSTNTTELNSQTKVSTQHELLVQEAREHGIKIVSLKDFLTYMGWKPESRIYLPGGGVPFNLKPGANPPALNELAQAPVALPKSAPITDEMKQFLTEWDTQNQKITTLESSFTRFEFDEVFGTETRSTGKFYLERPDRWRIDFEPADAALLAKPAGRKDADGTPFKVKPGVSSKWICTGKRVYILDVMNKAYDVLEFPPQGQGDNRARAGLPHAVGGPLPFLFFMTAQDAKQLFSLRFGAFHNSLGDKLDANGQPRRKAMHIMANPVDINIAKFYSQAEVIFDADTYLPLNLRTIDSGRNKETVYSFDQSQMKLGVKWDLLSPFHDPVLPGWKQTSLNDWPIEFPTMETIFKGMLSGNSIAPPQRTLDPASLARTISITDPETEVELAVHEIRLLQFPIAIAKAEVQYEPVLDVKPVRGQIDTLHIRAINDGRCQLIVTGTNDAVYRVGITAGTPPMNRFRDLDSSEEKAFRALQQHVSLEFPDTSLKEICRLMTAQHNLPFTLDTEDLKAAGADPDLHVSITASGPTLAQALTTMLEKVKEHPLDYYIDSGAVHISTVAAMKDRERLVYYRLACLSPEGQAAAEKYITPLAISVAPLEGDLLVDASVYTHKKFEEFLRGAWRLESQRPAREIPLGLSAPANRSPGAISPVPRTSPLEGSLPKPHSPELPLGLKPGQNPPEAIGGEGQPKSQSEEVFVSLKLFEVDEAGFRQLADEHRTEGTRKLTPKPDFPKLLRALTRENRGRLLEELTLASQMGRASKSMSGGDFPVPASETEGDKPARQEFGIMTEMTPIKREQDGRLVLKYDLEFSDRNFNNSIQTEGLVVPNVVAKVFRGFSILPVKGTDGILIGPVATISRSENDQPARNVSTYLWMREEVNNPLRLLPGPTNRP